ncbi:MAG: glycoside hydrolase family 43 protein [Clostridia bacterium]|nr:glycoside hydrolase family 43 protein [Clostridia bacterium]
MYNKYLFCYFTGNEPEKESINYALSEDGYHFKPLNGNKPILFNKLGTKGIRDPYIFRAQDSSFYIIGTDMRSEAGWSSNHAMCVWHSDDLINWEQYPVIDMISYGLEGSCRTWAPEVFYDKEKEMYMIYWANCQHNEKSDEWTNTVMWYAYTKDFRQLETAPAILYAPPCGKDAIDADIIENNGTFYMYYKDENEKYICYVYSDKLTGPYKEPENKNITLFDEATEGCCMYKIYGTDDKILIMDSYGKGRYVMQKTKDYVNFEKVDDSQYFLDFSPRHGSMLTVSEEEYNRVLEHFGW